MPRAVWVANLRTQQVLPLLNGIGGQRVFLSVNSPCAAETEELARQVKPFPSSIVVTCVRSNMIRFEDAFDWSDNEARE
jgi:hypothetical protein